MESADISVRYPVICYMKKKKRVKKHLEQGLRTQRSARLQELEVLYMSLELIMHLRYI